MEAMLPGPRSYQAHKRPQGQDRGGMLGFSGLPQHGHGSDTPPKVTGRIINRTGPERVSALAHGKFSAAMIIIVAIIIIQTPETVPQTPTNGPTEVSRGCACNDHENACLSRSWGTSVLMLETPHHLFTHQVGSFPRAGAGVSPVPSTVAVPPPSDWGLILCPSPSSPAGCLGETLTCHPTPAGSPQS